VEEERKERKNAVNMFLLDPDYVIVSADDIDFKSMREDHKQRRKTKNPVKKFFSSAAVKIQKKFTKYTPNLN
jgi:hypothetical protein